jgi:hypothetical protein
MNQGPNNVNQVTLTVTSSNPNVTFPDGNVLRSRRCRRTTRAPARSAWRQRRGRHRAADFKIAIDAPELGVPGPVQRRLHASRQLRRTAAGSATETVESSNPGWSVSGDVTTLPNIEAWQSFARSRRRSTSGGARTTTARRTVRRPIFPMSRSWSPRSMQVGTGPLTHHLPAPLLVRERRLGRRRGRAQHERRRNLDRHRRRRLQRRHQRRHQRPDRSQPPRLRQPHRRLAELRHRDPATSAPPSRTRTSRSASASAPTNPPEPPAGTSTTSP